MTMRRMRLLLGVVVAGCVLAAAGAAELDAYGLLARGNEHQAAGRYEEALADYAEAAHRGLPPEYEAELLHNQAAAHFRLGQFDDARDLWNRAAPRRDAGFEARMRYNLGNANHAAARQAAQAGDAAQARTLLGRAIDQYRDAVRLDPRLADARANLELAYRLRAQLTPPEDQPPQTQPSPQSQPSPDAEQSPESQPADSQPSPATQPQSDSEPQGAQREQQDSDAQQQGGQKQEPTATGESGEPGESQVGEGEAGQPQDGTTEAADDEARDTAEQQAQPSPLTPDQVQRMLQRVRDRDRQRRERLRQLEIQRALEAARNRPVERDW